MRESPKQRMRRERFGFEGVGGRGDGDDGDDVGEESSSMGSPAAVVLGLGGDPVGTVDAIFGVNQCWGSRRRMCGSKSVSTAAQIADQGSRP